ncbi:hypothetical protein [Novosphingobium sp. ST904]|uniref:DUF6950 family protein n=1 Tax=Novosphingobium sp. ST904 TaxID=1684385 RepID=UPI0006C8D024|nr:hypothetical protein [Novosphingobium sp. ST904]KPH66905.1 hypothetical protein ADT71_03910 [Novosphingobium sp. ST904]TCM39154.1 hypothetical protein EDF59_10633 [Novosphingobium sp. ST904]
MNLAERRDITAATLERFAGKPFAFGSCDCGLLVISHLKAMGWKIRTGGTWKSALALKRFLARHGGTGAACIDSWGVPRIPPAGAIIGDIVEIDGEPPFGAFGICLGNGRILAFHEDVDSAAVIQPTTPPIAAWRT